MMQAAAIGLGLRLRLLAEGADVSAARAVPDTVVGDYTDPATVGGFAAGCAAVTFDHEHVPTPILHELEAAGVAVRPGPAALVHAQDKAVMRARLAALRVPCPAWRVVDSPADLVAFADAIGWPVIAKTSRGGYDGKGVWKIVDAAGAAEPFAALAGPLGPTERPPTDADAHVPRPVIVAEEYVPFVRELSALVVRGADGAVVAYPVSETVQRDGICHETTTPAPGLDAERERAIVALATRIAGELGVVGVLAVELMERPDGGVVVNELAMRPHNTGHWTIDGARTSQFENHLRAVAGLPLGPTDLRAPVVVMSNVLGGTRTDLVGALDRLFTAFPDARVQLYGKDVKPGRKVGHVTVYGDDLAVVQARARAASDFLEGRPGALSDTLDETR
nr:5-(carboxyamino)imidazole ribonucleotide synthase [Propionibacterium sp.]